MILVPIKNTAAAKQRLAEVLDQPSRTKLAQAMLNDVLTTLHEWKNRPPVGVVTGDPYATNLAREYGFEVIPDRRQSRRNWRHRDGHARLRRARRR